MTKMPARVWKNRKTRTLIQKRNLKLPAIKMWKKKNLSPAITKKKIQKKVVTNITLIMRVSMLNLRRTKRRRPYNRQMWIKRNLLVNFRSRKSRKFRRL